MEKSEFEELREQAIRAEQLRIVHIETFLDGFPLDTDVNKCVALELATSISFIEQTIEELKNL